MHVKDILDKAKEKFPKYLNPPHTGGDEKKDNGVQFIDECKKYIEVFGENQKDRFIFLFSIFLHINSKDDLYVKFYPQQYPNQNTELLVYDICGYEEFNIRLNQDNFIFLEWLESELLNFNLKKKVERHNSTLSENSFHGILKNAFVNLQKIEELIFDIPKAKKRIIIAGTYYEVYQYRKINTLIKNDILRILTDLQFESIYHEIGNLIACIQYVTMYNEYTTGSSEREIYKHGTHDSIHKIYDWLENKLVDIKITKEKVRGRPHKIKSNAPTIKWNGGNKELKDLFAELECKGWITIENQKIIDVCESILDLFIINKKEKSLYEIMKPYNQKDENLTFLTNITKKENKKTRFSGIVDINKKIKT